MGGPCADQPLNAEQSQTQMEGKQTFKALILLDNVNSSGSTSKITDVATVVRKGVRGQVVGRGNIYVYKATGTWSMICGLACVHCVCLPVSRKRGCE